MRRNTLTMNYNTNTTETALSLLEDIIRHPAETFTVNVRGDSMVDAGIYEGDTLTVDRSLEARSGTIVVASLDGETLVKRLKVQSGRTYLISENQNYPPIEVTEYITFRILGVVTGLIRKM